MNKNFALVGAAGFVAPRHMKAIKAVDGNLVAALDPNDSVGVIDSYYPEASFFTEFERFDRFVDKLRRDQSENQVGYVSVCSPNYLHDSHSRFALRSGADAICEKPMVLNPWNLDGLVDLENDTGRSVYTILQLRLHPTIRALKESLAESSQKVDLDLTYITSRGSWYLQSWKGDDNKSGGIATNIGIHFFDMLHFLYGALQSNIVHHTSPTKAGGYLEFEGARVRWFLSVDTADIPSEVAATGQRTFRSITIDDELLEFSDGFADLHTISYEEILAGRGFGLEDSRAAIEAVSHIRNAAISPGQGEMHPLTKAARE